MGGVSKNKFGGRVEVALQLFTVFSISIAWHCLNLLLLSTVTYEARAAHDGSSALVVLVDSEDGPSDLNNAFPA